MYNILMYHQPVADPGFPTGGIDFIGGIDSRGGYVSKILYVEMKKSGPLGGHAPGSPLDLPMPSIVGSGGTSGTHPLIWI